MSVGGNGRARAFFKQHGWDDPGNDKLEDKYLSRAAQIYRKQLEKDATKLAATLSGAEPAAAPAEASAPPSRSASAASLRTQGSGVAAAPAAAAKPAAGAVAVAAAKPAAGAAAAATKPAARRPVGRLTLGAARKPPARVGAGLGVRKAKVDDSIFDQKPEEPEPSPIETTPSSELKDAIPRAASASSARSAAVAAAVAAAPAPAVEERKPAALRGKDGHLKVNLTSDFFSDPFATNSPKSPANGARGPFGRAAPPPAAPVPATTSTRSAAAPADSGSDTAQARFGNAKSISSASFFDKGSAADEAERQTRLSRFRNAGAISSDAYFGREDEAGAAAVDDLSASELVSKLTVNAREEYEQIKNIASIASSRFSQFAQGLVRDLQGGY